MKNFLAAAAIGLLVAACGTTSLGSGTPGPGSSPGSSPIASPAPSQVPGSPGFPWSGASVTVTEKEHVVFLQVGARLLVVLHTGTGMRLWSQPTSSDPKILAPLVYPAMVPIGVTLGAFQARTPGEATVTAVSGPDCASGQPCPMYAILYTLQVTVQEG
jgi:hypothetical protein